MNKVNEFNYTKEELNYTENVLLIGDEKIVVLFKEKRIIDDATAVGEFKGQIDIVYPFGGLDINLTLDIYNEKVDEDWEVDGLFKIPFCEQKHSLYDVWCSKGMSELSEMASCEDEYEKCSCGGDILPMYEEHPNWITFCRSCGATGEDVEHSPLPY